MYFSWVCGHFPIKRIYLRENYWFLLWTMNRVNYDFWPKIIGVVGVLCDHHPLTMVKTRIRYEYYHADRKGNDFTSCTQSSGGPCLFLAQLSTFNILDQTWVLLWKMLKISLFLLLSLFISSSHWIDEENNLINLSNKEEITFKLLTILLFIICAFLLSR